MKRTILTLLLAAVCTVATFAQEDANRDANGKVVRGPYLTNKFGDNWFIGAGVGASMYIGGFNSSFGARIRPTVDINFGKWFTPAIGARIDFNIAPMYREKVYGSWHKFTYWNLHADFLWNLSNTFGGYKETRVYQVIPFVGAGYAQNSGTSIRMVERGFALNGGIINKFRVSNRIDLNLEISATALEQSMDQISQCGSSTIDVPLSLVAGINVKLGKTNFQRASSVAQAPVTDASLMKEYEQFQKDLAAAKAENEKLQAVNDALKAAMAGMGAATVVTKEKSTTFVTMFFQIGQSTLSEKDLANLEVYMDGVSAIAKGDKKFHIVGAADKATGSHETNYRLSKERAEYVKNILVNKYGVKASNITLHFAGDADNRFDAPALNRTATLYITVE